MCSTQLVIIWHLAEKPYEDPIANKLELFNEYCVACLFSFILGYANPSINGPTKFYMGYFCIVIIILIMLVNFCTIVMRLWYDILIRVEKCFNVLVAKPLKNAKITPNAGVKEDDYMKGGQ